MRSDIAPGGTFPDYELLNAPGLREAWDAGDVSNFHGWDKRSPKRSRPSASA